MQKLSKLGILQGSRARVDYAKLGFGIEAFIGLYAKRGTDPSSIAELLEGYDEVLACYYTTGIYSFFTKILCKKTEAMRELLAQLEGIELIERAETLIVLDTSFDRPLRL